MTQLSSILTATPYRAYTYAYPHKTAYRTLSPAVPLHSAWAGEDKQNLFLYLHIPFCEMRCGFCNLFTTVNPEESLEKAYLGALERQARIVREALGEAAVSRVAIGGGTPTYLAPGDLERLLNIVRDVFGADLARIPSSIETSPATVTPERLHLLKSAGVERVSMGVQSFIEAEARAAGTAPAHGRGAGRTGASERLQFPGAEPRSDLRTAGTDTGVLALLAGRNAQPRAAGNLPVSAVRAPADRAGPHRARVGR